MATLSAQIQDLVGSFTDETAMDQWLEDGAKEIINALPRNLQKLCTSIQSFTSVAAGSEAETLNTGKVFSVFAGSVDCRKIDSTLKYRAEDSGRIDYATSTDPVYYVESNFINVLPTSLSCKYEEVQYPSSIDADSDSAIASFPDEAEHLVVLYASLKALQQQMNTKQGDLPADVVVPVLETISESLPTWTAPSDFVVPVKPAVPTISSQSVSITGTAPTYVKPAFAVPTLGNVGDLVLPAILPSPTISSQVVADPSSYAPTYIKPSLALQVAPTISDLSITAVPPDTPSLSSITFTSVDSDVDAVFPTSNPYTIATVSGGGVFGANTAPAYTKPTITARVAFSGYTSGLSEADPGVLSITAVFPAVPSAPSYTTPDVSSTTVASTTVTVLGVPPIYTVPVVAGATEELTATITDGTVGTDADWQDFSDWFEVLGQMIEDNEDIEMASIQLNKISTYIQSYQAALQNQLNIFNKNNVAYQGKLQEGIQQAQINATKAQGQAQISATEAQQEASLLLQKEQQEYSATLQKYQAEVSTYQANINKEVQAYGQKLQHYSTELSTAYQAWAKTESDSLQQYSSDIQNNLNDFNRANAEYQVKLQEAIQQAQLSSQKAQQQAQIDSTDAQQEASLKLQKENQEYSSKLQKYQAEVGTYSAEVNTNAQTFTNAVAKNRAAFDTSLQKYTSEIQKVSASNASILQKFTGEVGNFSAKLQKQGADYTWYQGQYTQLKADYTAGLAALKGTQQQGE